MTATMINGVPTPDVPLSIPDPTRVRLIVEPIEPKRDSVAALNAFEERQRFRPVHGGGKKFTRDELHQRR
ncbi:MAG TPA: hypothetical protein VHR72_09360 [Gemmataceae bacterium]|nr:hypothetical protein [Gemmataceae bacterium]